MKHKLNRLTAIFLSFILLLSACPLSALAAILEISSGEIGLPVARTYEFYTEDGKTRLAKQQVVSSSWLNTYYPPADPEGRPFIGWFTQQEGGDRFNGFGRQHEITNMETIELYARYESRILHTIRYQYVNSNGMVVLYKEIRVEHGEEIDLSLPLTLGSWSSLSAWELEHAEGETTAITPPLKATKDMILVAINQAEMAPECKIVYDAGDGTGTVPVDNNRYGVDSVAILKRPEQLEGPAGRPYFEGWVKQGAQYYQAGDSYRFFFGEVVTLVARWSAPPTTEDTTPTTITYHQNGGVSDYQAIKVVQASTSSTLNLPEVEEVDGMSIEGAFFQGWSTEPHGYNILTPGTSVYIDRNGENHLYAV